MKSPRPPSLNRNRKPASSAALCGVAIIWLGGAIAVAQTVGEDALKRPIAEAGLTEPAGTVEAPRAVAVRPVAEDAPVQIPKPTGATEITAMEATFDNRKHEAVFSRKVMVTDPEFSVTCDRLTAVLKHSGSAANGKPTERSPAAAPQPAGKSQGGLERAIAEGNVVIKQSKTEADGSTSLSVGRAQRADYNAVTGDITLSGSPSVQQGFNQCVATSPETVMTLNRDRNMRVVGPHRTIISDKADLESPPKSKDQ